MEEFIQKGNSISFKVLGDGKGWELCFSWYDNDKQLYWFYKIPTKKGKIKEIEIPYNSIRFGDSKFNKEDIILLSIHCYKPGKKTDRSIKIFDVQIY